MAPVTATLARWMGMAGGVTQHAGTDPDQFGLEARQRPVGHGLGQFDAAQEGGEVMGQSVLEQRPCRGPCACPWIARAKQFLRLTPVRPLLPVALAARGPGRAVFKGEPFALGVIGDRVWRVRQAAEVVEMRLRGRAFRQFVLPPPGDKLVGRGVVHAGKPAQGSSVIMRAFSLNERARRALSGAFQLHAEKSRRPPGGGFFPCGVALGFGAFDHGQKFRPGPSAHAAQFHDLGQGAIGRPTPESRNADLQFRRTLAGGQQGVGARAISHPPVYPPGYGMA